MMDKFQDVGALGVLVVTAAIILFVYCAKWMKL